MTHKTTRQSSMVERDEIAEAVLKDVSASALAREMKASVQAVYSIVNRYCLEANPSAYRRLRSQAGQSFSEYPLWILRRHRKEFQKKHIRGCTDRASSIWCLEGISGITLSGLYKNGVDTIDDFMRIPHEKLAKLRQVGPAGLRKVIVEIQRLGIAEPEHPADTNKTSCR